MLTPDERKAMREWQKSQMTEDERLLQKARQRLAYERKKKLREERRVLNDWNK